MRVKLLRQVHVIVALLLCWSNMLPQVGDWMSHWLSRKCDDWVSHYSTNLIYNLLFDSVNHKVLHRVAGDSFCSLWLLFSILLRAWFLWVELFLLEVDKLVHKVLSLVNVIFRIKAIFMRRLWTLCLLPSFRCFHRHLRKNHLLEVMSVHLVRTPISYVRFAVLNDRRLLLNCWVGHELALEWGWLQVLNPLSSNQVDPLHLALLFIEAISALLACLFYVERVHQVLSRWPHRVSAGFSLR